MQDRRFNLPPPRQLLRLLDGSEKVTCQHGPRECQGNARHACLLSRLSSGSQDRRVEAVDCLMRDRDPDRAVPGCLASLGLARPTAESVERCAGSSEGRDLVRMFSGETEALAPKLDFVPWLLIDDVSGVVLFFLDQLCRRCMRGAFFFVSLCTMTEVRSGGVPGGAL